jgi:hypothetical protein
MNVRRLTAVVVLVVLLAVVAQQRVFEQDDAAPSAEIDSSPAGPGFSAALPSGAKSDDGLPASGADGACVDARDWCGRVIDAISLEPLQKFDVSLREYREAVASPGEVIDRHFETRDGRFAFIRLTPRDWQVEIRASGYQVFRIDALPFPVQEPGSETVIPMRRGLVLKGGVYDEATGAALGGASISFRESQQALYDSGWRDRPTVTSKPDGTFELAGLPQGRIALMVEARDYAFTEYWTDTATHGPVEIPLSAGGSIAGHVVHPDGTAASGASISVFSLDPDFGSTTPTDGGGRFERSGLAPGRYRLSAESEAGRSREVQVSLRNGQRIEGLELRLEGVHAIRGTVTGLSAAEREVTTVQLLRGERWEIGIDGPLQAALGTDGRYVLERVAPGPARLMAVVGEGRRLEKAFEMPADRDLTIDFGFPAGFRLSGQVRRGGETAPRMWVQLLSHVSQREFSSNGTMTSESGTYEFVGVPKGLYRVRAGFIDTRTVQVDGDTTLDFDLPTGKFAGRVVEADGGAPVVGAEIQVWSGNTNPPVSAFASTTDAFGAFSMDGLSPGEYVVTVYRPDFEYLQQRLMFATSVADQVLPLHREEGVELRAHDRQSGDAVRHVYVSEADTLSNAGVAKPGALARFIVRLDATGVGRLPRGVLEQPVAFWAEDYAPIKITAWDGEPLDLRFSRVSQDP